MLRTSSAGAIQLPSIVTTRTPAKTGRLTPAGGNVGPPLRGDEPLCTAACREMIAPGRCCALWHGEAPAGVRSLKRGRVLSGKRGVASDITRAMIVRTGHHRHGPGQHLSTAPWHGGP